MQAAATFVDGNRRMIDYVRPADLADAVGALDDDAARPLAGGTDLMNEIRLGRAVPRRVVDLAGLAELDGISSDGAGVVFGSSATMRQILATPGPPTLGALHDAAELLGGRQIQAVATLGGNLCHASPAAETATPMLVHDAVARIAGPSGGRSIAMTDFWLGPGRTSLSRGELLVGLAVAPRPAAWYSAYRRIELRRSVDIAIASAAVAIDVTDGTVRAARVALGALGPVPFRVPEAERVLEGVTLDDTAGAPPDPDSPGTAVTPFQAAAATAADVCVRAAEPIDDVRASARYRRAMTRVVVARAAVAAAARSRGGLL